MYYDSNEKGKMLRPVDFRHQWFCPCRSEKSGQLRTLQYVWWTLAAQRLTTSTTAPLYPPDITVPPRSFWVSMSQSCLSQTIKKACFLQVCRNRFQKINKRLVRRLLYLFCFFVLLDAHASKTYFAHANWQLILLSRCDSFLQGVLSPSELGWSHPCDVWSIGCILFEYYVGFTLFQV